MMYLTLKQAAYNRGMTYEAFLYYVKNQRGPEMIAKGKRLVLTSESLENWRKVDKRKLRYSGKLQESVN